MFHFDCKSHRQFRTRISLHHRNFTHRVGPPIIYSIKNNCILCNAGEISSYYSFACAMLKSVMVKPTPIGPSVVVKPFTCHHIQSIYLFGHRLAPPRRLCLAPADNPLDLASGAFDTAFCGLTPHIVSDGRPFAWVRTAIVVLKGCTLEHRLGLRRQAHVVTHLAQYYLPSWAAGPCRLMKCDSCVLRSMFPTRNCWSKPRCCRHFYTMASLCLKKWIGSFGKNLDRK